MSKKGEYIKFKKYEGKIWSLFAIFVDFEIILVPEINGKQNPEDSYTNKLQKHVACSCGYKLVCVDDNFSKPFKIYLGKDAVYNVINSMIKESKYYSDAIKKINKEFVMAKEDYENFKKSSKSWVYDNDYIDNDFKVRDHCHITGKHRGSAYRDRKFLVVFCNVKNMIFILLCKN